MRMGCVKTGVDERTDRPAKRCKYNLAKLPLFEKKQKKHRRKSLS